MSKSAMFRQAAARVGKRVRGKWVLEELVGFGGMAAVYRARHRNGARVAIKMLHGNSAASRDLRARFVGEGYAANRIDHPAVVRVLDDDVDEQGTPFLIMDFVEGRTLTAAIADGCFDDDQLLEVAEQVCGALSAAHGAGVVHRDLKPDNLLLEPNGRIRVLDFGIARLIEDDESYYGTTTGVAFGTPGFISPEQALGLRDQIGPCSDVFGLGATLFHLATTEYLHAARTRQELLVLVATKPARALRDVAPHVSPEVAAIVDRATRMAVDERWPSAAAMLQAVRAVRRARPGAFGGSASTPSTLPPPPPEPSRPRIAASALRRRRAALSVACAMMLLGIGSAFAASGPTRDASADGAVEPVSDAPLVAMDTAMDKAMDTAMNTAMDTEARAARPPRAVVDDMRASACIDGPPAAIGDARVVHRPATKAARPPIKPRAPGKAVVVPNPVLVAETLRLKDQRDLAFAWKDHRYAALAMSRR
ncbi:MAG: serine/threonine protein kinase [Deltaproteobacteria bacterium]|nr:serine/threonine protein kinase [Deltaproteobacteria bacterium]